MTNSNPAFSSSGNINFYIIGQMPKNVYQVVTNASGALAPYSNGQTVPGIPFYGGSTTSGQTSQAIHLPPLISARIYISYGPLSITTNSGPAPWAGDSSAKTYWDFVEYNWASTTSTAYVDTSQVNAVGLALWMNLIGTGNTSTGFKAGAITAMFNGIQSLGAPWTTLNAQQPYRVLSPSSVQWGPSGNPSLPGFFPGNFLDSSIQTAWDSYKAPAWITLQKVNANGFTTLYGQVDASENFNFYTSQVASGTPVATIPSIFNFAYGFNQTATQDVFLQNQPFLLPASGPSGGSWPYNATSPDAAGTIGNMISTAINRGVFGNSQQEDCDKSHFYKGVPYQNQYAAVVHAVANNPAYGDGVAYALPYDDQCDFSSTITDTAPRILSVTIYPS